MLCSHALPATVPVGDTPVRPMPPPTTVISTDPVAAWLLLLNPLASALSADPASVALPPPTPTVTATARVPASARPARHSAEVSDTHVLCSLAVVPARACTERSSGPSLPPASVKLSPPVAAWFPALPELTAALSQEPAADAVPGTCPTDRVRADDAARLRPTAHRSDVSDTQSVACAALPPSPPRAEPASAPALSPATVTLRDPVEAPFHTVPPLARGPSTDPAPDAVPHDTPAVTLVIHDRPSPRPPSPCTPESDSHWLASQTLSPIRTDAVTPLSPSPAPPTVTTADPVAARFAPCTQLAVPPPPEITAVALPASSPAVSPTALDPPTPCPALHRTDDSDSHVLCSHALPATVPVGEKSARPTFAPVRVMRMEPVASPFVLSTSLACLPSYDMPSLIEPLLLPKVILSWLDLAMPPLPLHCSAVSDAHTLASHVDPTPERRAEAPAAPT